MNCVLSQADEQSDHGQIIFVFPLPTYIVVKLVQKVSNRVILHNLSLARLVKFQEARLVSREGHFVINMKKESVGGETSVTMQQALMHCMNPYSCLSTLSSTIPVFTLQDSLHSSIIN